ncbi:hypothetical protein NL676_010388 [Syzygium grande]|nr:hypothetical protein NL676_010388 [Syzygium grande]
MAKGSRRIANHYGLEQKGALDTNMPWWTPRRLPDKRSSGMGFRTKRAHRAPRTPGGGMSGIGGRGRRPRFDP